MNPFDQATADNLRRPPEDACALLVQWGAPPRLIAHLILVHDVAHRLLDALASEWTSLRVRRDLIRFGAATHDIGKALVPAELSSAGKAHEEAGYKALLRAGVGESKARFATTHGLPPDAEALSLDDLIVMTADKVWKGKRHTKLEERLAHEIAAQLQLDLWKVLPPLLEILDELSERADYRLAWQNQFSALP